MWMADVSLMTRSERWWELSFLWEVSASTRAVNDYISHHALPRCRLPRACRLQSSSLEGLVSVRLFIFISNHSSSHFAHFITWLYTGLLIYKWNDTMREQSLLLKADICSVILLSCFTAFVSDFTMFYRVSLEIITVFCQSFYPHLPCFISSCSFSCISDLTMFL